MEIFLSFVCGNFCKYKIAAAKIIAARIIEWKNVISKNINDRPQMAQINKATKNAVLIPCLKNIMKTTVNNDASDIAAGIIGSAPTTADIS